MQPDWVSLTDSAGGDQCAAGRPSLIHTNAFRRVPFLFTTTVCALTGVLCSRSQDGFDDMSIKGISGAVPRNATRPEMLPPVEGSTCASGIVLTGSAAGFAPLPHPQSNARGKKAGITRAASL